MEKLFWGLLIAVFLLPGIFAEGIGVEKVDKGSVIIAEFGNPAVFEFVINNAGGEDSLEIYSLTGVSMSPKGMFSVSQGINRIEVTATPGEQIMKNRGTVSFEYQLRGQRTGIRTDTLMIKIVSLSEAIDFKAKNIEADDTSAEITVRNIENMKLDGLKVRVKSLFFDGEETISLEPYGSEKIIVPIDNSAAKKLFAGPYVMTVYFELNGVRKKVEGTINYLEKEGISVKEGSSGFILRKNSVEKINEGNVPIEAEIVFRRDIITRLFTVYSSEPDDVKRSGLMVNYVWRKEISPGESFTVTASTNYIFPLILLVLAVLIVLFVKTYTLTSVILNKNVSFVKTRGGEFALRVRVRVKARKSVGRIQITDYFPHSAQVYEKFGVSGGKLDEANRKIMWGLNSLQSGEERVFSYIIYSKIRVIGSYSLPVARAVFEKEGKTETVVSNKTFFVSETTSTDYK